MAILGCTNPAAVNYDPAADTDDGSCVYLSKVGGICYAFEDAANQADNSFTLSFSSRGDNWVFYHDYLPDFYFHQRDQLYNLRQGKIYLANKGAVGKYHDQTTTKSFFIDLVLKNQTEEILNTVSWITEIFNPANIPVEFTTFSHITVWNNYQCTGRISLADNFQDLEYVNDRLTGGKWTFNNFRDLVIDRGSQFLEDLFKDFRPIPTALSSEQAWYDQLLMEDKYFIIRFEFDNLDNNKLFFHGAGKDTTIQVR